eukprot:GAFH01000843.1.p1 GENE.GAFH01000843.1~~GAFH01000843.1.p1  ORF type:complete len:841 (-),score=273.50 GAFH01000843.1:108-2321(-)
MRANGLDPSKGKPNMRSLNFIQIDEFYPMDPQQKNSFFHYVQNFYIQGFGLDPAKCHLIDCSSIGMEPVTIDGKTFSLNQKFVWPDDTVDLSLRYRSPKNEHERIQAIVLSRIDQWCQTYEANIRKLGGIGFFLGGIGPDGHIGFNVQGSDHFCTTRLCPTNYMTQAAAANDLGGIEVSRTRLVITIGLGTITFNPRCVAIIIAAGEAKAPVVEHAIQCSPPNVDAPASSLHCLVNARFYITQGAASMLTERNYAHLCACPSCSDAQVEYHFVEAAARLGVRILDLTRDQLMADRFTAAVLQRRKEPLEELKQLAYRSLVSKIEKGVESINEATFLHTEPHHDDIMLGYLPAVVRHLNATNDHNFATCTSGFTSVTNGFLATRVEAARRFLAGKTFPRLWQEGYFCCEPHVPCPASPSSVLSSCPPSPAPATSPAVCAEEAARLAGTRQTDVWVFLDGVAQKNPLLEEEGLARRFVRNLITVYELHTPEELLAKLGEITRYLEAAYPGMKDVAEIQRLKGMCREWEADCLWGYFGWSCDHIHHLRLGFYQGNIFTEEPTVKRDVEPISQLLEQIKPTHLTCALDPEGSGPDTHYKVLQAVSSALGLYQQRCPAVADKMRIWGYRNVWFRFHPSEANCFVPVSMTMFSVLHDSFMNTFASQKNASFPSYMLDGPFCDLAQSIQAEQYRKLKICLGADWFQQHPNPEIRATRGFIFLTEMSIQEFASRARILRSLTQNI